MIVIEERLRDLFNLIPNIQVNASNSLKPKFSWGKKEELNRYIKLNKSKSYPLIWLLPNVDIFNYSSKLVTRKCSFVIATLETRDELLNAQRYQGSYKNTLNPLTNYVVQALTNSSITRVVSTEIEILKEPNYADKEESGTIDKWDAVRVECEVEINNFCLKPLKWRE